VVSFLADWLSFFTLCGAFVDVYSDKGSSHSRCTDPSRSASSISSLMEFLKQTFSSA
jgi:hypothetical protein